MADAPSPLPTLSDQALLSMATAAANESTLSVSTPAATTTTTGASAMGGTANTPAAESNVSAGATTPLGRPGGAPARVYMNEKIVPYLLEGMKNVTKDQPPNPLRVLGEFLIQKSNEIESGQQQQQQAGKTPE